MAGGCSARSIEAVCGAMHSDPETTEEANRVYYHLYSLDCGSSPAVDVEGAKEDLLCDPY